MPTRLFMGALGAFILSGCQPPPSAAPEQVTASSEINLVTSSAPQMLVSKSWCSVENLTEHSKSVVTVNFLSEGYALFRQLDQNPETDRFNESGGLFSWTLQNDLLTYRDFESGEAFESHFRWTTHTPLIDKDSLLKDAVLSAEQSCFQVTSTHNNELNKMDIFCPCDPEKIWDSSTAE